MKTITNDPQDFIENGGWSFLEPDSSVSHFEHDRSLNSACKAYLNHFDLIPSQEEEQEEEEDEESEYAPSGSDGVEDESEESELSGETEESEEDSGRFCTLTSNIYRLQVITM